MSAEATLVGELAARSGDPLRFVLWAFPWGEPGSELENSSGPEPWQRTILEAVRDGLLTLGEAIQIAIASGHGIGKSALVAWLILWAISTFEDTRGVVTANTENQLKTKTWAELSKWFRSFIGRSLFHMTATAIYSADPNHERTWRVDMIPWSERNTEAFAGLHNKGKRILVVYDEASAIPDVIWETTEGALTDTGTQILWFCAGNPTKNSGRFRECFRQYAHRWRTLAVDSREVTFTNKAQIAKWIEDYGEDSDFVRIRVKGTFPRTGSLQFISSDIVIAAANRELVISRYDPFIISVDVARFGDDETVIHFRKGRDARSIEPIRLQGADTMTTAGRVSQEMERFRADAVFVDGGGVGGGVVDRLRQLRVPCFDIQFGSKPDRLGLEGVEEKYANKRAEMWGYMREWLRGGCIPDNADLRAQLEAPQYGFNARDEIQLETKADMKRRGAASPDIADALALSFAYPVQANLGAGHIGAGNRPLVETDYDPLEYAKVA